MNTWRAATKEAVQTLLDNALNELSEYHRTRFESIRIQLRRVPIADCPGETVYVVAEHEGKILYYSDVEEGWELEEADEAGGIASRGCNQYELSHIMSLIFGVPES